MKNKIIGMIFFGIFFMLANINFVDANTINMEGKSDYSLTPYWGNSDLKLTNGTGFFDTHQDNNGVWWFVDPDGYAFYSVGKDDVAAYYSRKYSNNILEKYGSYEHWAENVTIRYKNWSLNTLGAWSNYSLINNASFAKYETKIPYTHFFSFKNEGRGIWKAYIMKHIPDVFDDYFWNLVNDSIKEVAEKLRDDPYLIGYWLDNEMHWEPCPYESDELNKKTLLEDYISISYERFQPGKMRAVEFLIDRYENEGIEKFNEVWNTNLDDFEELYDVEELGREGWRIISYLMVPKLKLIRDTPILQIPKILLNTTILKRVESDIREFNRLVAHAYFENVTNIIEWYDPNHLTLGVRFHMWGAPEEVIRECGEHCDVISVNYYRKHLLFYDPIRIMQSLRVGVIPLDNWMESYYDISGKPIIIGEWGTDLTGPFDQISIPLPEKWEASYYYKFAEKCVEMPYIVGFQGWYRAQTESKSGITLLNVEDEPYILTTENASKINNQIYEIHSGRSN